LPDLAIDISGGRSQDSVDSLKLAAKSTRLGYGIENLAIASMN